MFGGRSFSYLVRSVSFQGGQTQNDTAIISYSSNVVHWCTQRTYVLRWFECAASGRLYVLQYSSQRYYGLIW